MKIKMIMKLTIMKPTIMIEDLIADHAEVNDHADTDTDTNDDDYILDEEEEEDEAYSDYKNRIISKNNVQENNLDVVHLKIEENRK